MKEGDIRGVLDRSWTLKGHPIVSGPAVDEMKIKKLVQRKPDLLDLMAWIEKVIPEAERKLCLEIGMCHGGTHVMWKTMFQKVISIDDQWKNVAKMALGVTEPERSRIVWGNSGSPEVATHVEQMLESQLDMLFIDGDHTYNGVSADWENYAKLVRPGGIVAFHDANNHKMDPRHGKKCAVFRFLNDLKSGIYDADLGPIKFQYGDGNLQTAAYIKE